MISKTARFFRHHWQGRVALVPTLILTVLGLRFALAWLTRLRPQDWPLPLFVLFTLLSTAILVWQIVGAFRATRPEQGGLGLAATIAACLTAFALFLTSELDSYAVPLADLYSHARPAITPLPVTGTTARIEGDLTWPLYARFCDTLIAHPDLTTVSLISDGGLVPVARGLAARIIETGLDTIAPGRCASACTLVFMAGAGRSLGPGGELGFHRYRLDRYDTLQSVSDEERRDIDWLIARGLDPDFVARAFATPHDSLWRPDRATLRAAGVLIARPDPAPTRTAPDCPEITPPAN